MTVSHFNNWLQRFLERILPWASKAEATNQKRRTAGHKCDGTIYKNVVQLVLLNFPLTKKKTTENVKMLEFPTKASLGEYMGVNEGQVNVARDEYIFCYAS